MEKPTTFLSPWAVTGLYVYDQTVTGRARELKPSKRRELEITDLNNLYALDDQLRDFTLGRGTAWMDCGLPDSLLEASQYVQAIQHLADEIGCGYRVVKATGIVARLLDLIGVRPLLELPLGEQWAGCVPGLPRWKTTRPN